MEASGNYDESTSSTEKLQESNATGAGQNEQGRASFTTGSTTGGGSNYGQGSHHLGGESYKQGSTSNAGANYSNEAGRLGSSSTGTSNEGRSSSTAGAAQSGQTADQGDVVALRDDKPYGTDGEARGQGSKAEDMLKEGDSRDTTGLEQDTHLDTDNTTGSRRAKAGSWSNSSEGSES